ncbi:MAG: hypothetical protein Q8N98_02325, partial [bacterium]|nr:hypothetical protein [bacterium]
FSQEIILDNLKPRKSTKVIIWSRPPYDPLIRINYDDKSIKPSKKTVTSGILGWFARNRYVINTVLATFFIPFIIVFSIMHLIDKIKNRRELKGKVKQKS